MSRPLFFFAMPNPQQLARSLDEQRAEYARRRGLAMPLAGMIVWALIGIAGAFLPAILAVWSLFIGAGFIAYLGILLSRLTGENFLDKTKPKNVFDGLFFYCVAMALLVYAIAIPFFRVDYTSLPLTVGFLVVHFVYVLRIIDDQAPAFRCNGLLCGGIFLVDWPEGGCL